MGPIISNLCTCSTAPPQLGPGLAGSLFCHVMGFNIGSQYGRSRHRQRVPSGSSLDLLCLARDHLPHRVRCPSQTACSCLAETTSICECWFTGINLLGITANRVASGPWPLLKPPLRSPGVTKCAPRERTTPKMINLLVQIAIVVALTLLNGLFAMRRRPWFRPARHALGSAPMPASQGLLRAGACQLAEWFPLHRADRDLLDRGPVSCKQKDSGKAAGLGFEPRLTDPESVLLL
jgi:hypothetical protein